MADMSNRYDYLLEQMIPDAQEISDHRMSQIIRVKDPMYTMQGHPVPALTTLLYKVCDNNSEKFNEACRLIDLFMDEVEH
jgi:hypothetical protein